MVRQSTILFCTLLMVSSCISTVIAQQPVKKNKAVEKAGLPGSAASHVFVGPGGGGALFNPAISPFNTQFVFTGCDMGGSFVTHNGGDSWRMFNLHSMVSSFVFDPSDSNTVYANSFALFRSSDRGKTWNVLYPAADEIREVVSKGDHASEILVTADSTERNVEAFAVDPADSKKLYAVIAIEKQPAFYASTDRGLHWTKEKDLDDHVLSLFIDPSSLKTDRRVYLTAMHSIFSKDQGVWKQHMAPAAVNKFTQYSAGYDQQSHRFVIYGICGKSFYDAKDGTQGIFYTADGGATWENRQDGLLSLGAKSSSPVEWRSIATSISHPATVYISYNNLAVSVDTLAAGVAISHDFGKTWKLCWRDLIEKETEQPAPNVSGGWLDERFGHAWSGNPLSLVVAPSNPGICYATDLGRIIKTTNAGKNWEQVYTKKKPGGGWISRGIEVTTGYNIAFDPFDHKHAFIADTDIGLLESHDGGESWSSATKNNGVPPKWTNTTYKILFDPATKGKAWAVMSGTHDLPRPKMWRRNPVSGFVGGIVQTTDGGKTWRAVSADIGEAAVTDILIDRSDHKNTVALYACVFGKGVYKSVDDGKTWQQKNNGIDGKEPFAWRMEKREKDGTLFLIISRRSEDGSIGNEMDGAVYRSVDGGDNWTKMNLPAGTNAPTSLLTNDTKDGRLLLTAWGRETKGKFTADTGGGIFISDNDGQTWNTVMTKDQQIYEISIDARINRYYACGFNGSAYFSDDTGMNWKRIKGYNFKWGKTVQPDPFDPQKIYIISFGGSIWHGSANGDNKALEDILTPSVKYH